MKLALQTRAALAVLVLAVAATAAGCGSDANEPQRVILVAPPRECIKPPITGTGGLSEYFEKRDAHDACLRTRALELEEWQKAHE